MTQYLYQIRRNSEAWQDLIGLELPTLGHARAAAFQLLADLALDEIALRLKGGDWEVEVSDQGGLLQFKLYVNTTDAPSIA